MPQRVIPRTTVQAPPCRSRPGRRAVPVHIPKPDPRPSDAVLWLDACAGREPAEALPTRDREDLVVDLFDRGWTLQQVADHTRMTEYTTARIARRVFGFIPGLA